MRINTTFVGDKVPTRTKWLYPMSGIGRDMAYTLVSLFLVTFLQYTMTNADGLYHQKMLAITIILVIYRIWDGINDPMIGTLIENAKLKMGKYKPWILYGGIVNAIALALLFSIPSTPGWGYVVFFGIMYLIWEISFTFNDIAYWSLLPSLSSDSKQRAELTTLVSVFASVGAFLTGGLVPFLSGQFVMSDFYMVFGIVTASIFLLGQFVIVFFTQERERPVIEEKQEKETFKSMLKVIWGNKQLFCMMVVITLYYLGSALLNGLGLNYFYFAFGFEIGGGNMTLFTVAYAIGTIVSQLIFPLLRKYFKMKKLILYSFILMVLGYVTFFVGGLIPALNNTSPNIILMTLLGLIIFAGQGVFYMTLLIMVTNTIEYNEWKTGKRNESIIFSARPFAAKLSSSLQTLVVYLVLLTGGIYGVTEQIGTIQANGAQGTLTPQEVISQSSAVIEGAAARYTGSIALLVGMCIVPILLYVGAFVYIKLAYKIDETNYEKMIEDIKQGNIGTHNKL